MTTSQEGQFGCILINKQKRQIWAGHHLVVCKAAYWFLGLILSFCRDCSVGLCVPKLRPPSVSYLCASLCHEPQECCCIANGLVVLKTHPYVFFCLPLTESTEGTEHPVHSAGLSLGVVRRKHFLLSLLHSSTVTQTESSRLHGC